MAEDDEGPRRAAAQKISGHVIGQKLDDLSVHDFDERIALLKTEIERLDQAKRQKQAARESAGSVFRI